MSNQLSLVNKQPSHGIDACRANLHHLCGIFATPCWRLYCLPPKNNLWFWNHSAEIWLENHSILVISFSFLSLFQIHCFKTLKIDRMNRTNNEKYWMKEIYLNTFEYNSNGERTIIRRFKLFLYLLIREINERFEDLYENSRIINLKRRFFFSWYDSFLNDELLFTFTTVSREHSHLIL